MRKLVVFSLFLAVVVIILGAYTRLTDAGLGCPDWPGCYGFLTVPSSEQTVAQANEAYPERPVEAFKAWNEMVHRYFAGALGLCILAIAVISVRGRHNGTPVKLPLFLLALVTFQALLGMWTVTLNLLPIVVMGHLLGGFTVLTCLFLLYLRLPKTQNQVAESRSNSEDARSTLLTSRGFKLCIVGVAVLVGQIALGGWTSANYAALACTEMPVCESGWQERLDFSGAYSVPDVENYEYGAHDYGERMTMHIVHRFGAVVTFAYLLALGAMGLFSKTASSGIKRISGLMLIALFAQVGLGVSNILFSLPLAVAVAHNAVAALLLLSLVWLSWTIFSTRVSSTTLESGVSHG